MIKSVQDIDVKGKFVLFRPDINSPLDSSGKIVNFNRINATVPTLNYLLENKAKVALIAHQGDVLDYQNLGPLEEHAKILSDLTKKKIEYIDDVCGDAAVEKIKALKEGEAVILGNLRYLAEEMSSFEEYVKLTDKQMANVYLIRRLAPLFDVYVNDAFAAAHRDAPSMVGFQKYLPSAAGFLFAKEYSVLSKVLSSPKRPLTFVFGGAKVSDSFNIIEKILGDKVADLVLAGGLLAQLLLVAKGINLGANTYNFLKNKNILAFTKQAKTILNLYPDKIILPVDFAYENNGIRKEVGLNDITDDMNLFDIGQGTVEIFREYIMKSKTIFYNGPVGVYENAQFKLGTESIFDSILQSGAFSIIGGGDTITAAKKLSNLDKFSYVSTAGGAMIQFLSGKKLPLIKAMEEGM